MTEDWKWASSKNETLKEQKVIEVRGNQKKKTIQNKWDVAESPAGLSGWDKLP